MSYILKGSDEKYEFATRMQIYMYVPYIHATATHSKNAMNRMILLPE